VRKTLLLNRRSVDWNFVDHILLTGGSSLLLKQPHQAVAFGAALDDELVRQKEWVDHPRIND